jgi:hypothetical protein
MIGTHHQLMVWKTTLDGQRLHLLPVRCLPLHAAGEGLGPAGHGDGTDIIHEDHEFHTPGKKTAEGIAADRPLARYAKGQASHLHTDARLSQGSVPLTAGTRDFTGEGTEAVGVEPGHPLDPAAEGSTEYGRQDGLLPVLGK